EFVLAIAPLVFVAILRPPAAALFPYTTLFRSQPGAWPALLRAGLARPCPTIRGDEVANRAGLVGEVRRHERPLRRVGRAAEHIVSSHRLDDAPVLILLIAEQAAVVVPHGNARRAAPALGDEDQVSPIGLEALGLRDDRRQRIVRFAVREHDEHAVGE